MSKKIILLITALCIGFTFPASATEAGETVVVEIMASEEGFPISEELNKYIGTEEQKYIYYLAKERGLGDYETLVYYGTLIGLADAESDFQTRAYNKRTGDRGLFQVNKQWVSYFKRLGWISEAEDLYNPLISARCGEHIFWEGYQKYGFSEESYSVYLFGEKHSSTKATRRAWNKMKKWVGVFTAE